MMNVIGKRRRQLLAVSGDQKRPPPEVRGRVDGRLKELLGVSIRRPRCEDNWRFAAGKKPFETTKLGYGTQVLWPDHCVQGTEDAALRKDLVLPKAQLIIRKGYHQSTDSYSAFMEADGKTSTGLAAYLKAHGVDTVYVCGLATDFCVSWTALDARKAGFKAYVIEDASRGIDLNGSLAAAWDKMTKAGVKRIQSSDIVA